MTNERGEQRSGLTYLDGQRLTREIELTRMTLDDFARLAGLSKRTVDSAMAGKGVFEKTAKCIATALGYDSPQPLEVRSSEESELPRVNERLVHCEWMVSKYHGPWIETSNGLQFRVCGMQHRHIDTRNGRGKWYDLRHLSTDKQLELRDHLSRHPEVSDRTGPDRHIAENIGCFSADRGESWWVVDRWVGAETLASRLGEHRTWPRSKLPKLMTQIARGLEVLHGAEIVFRELAPTRVLLADDDGRAVLTEFELAKLLGKHGTVSKKWKEDKYRAPEVESGSADERSDLYSWARVLLRAVAGPLPEKGCDRSALDKAGLPKKVWRVAADCLRVLPRERPEKIGLVLDAISDWK